MIPPTPYELARRRTARRFWLIVAVVTSVLLVACCAVSLTYGPYATDHDIPNPY